MKTCEDRDELKNISVDNELEEDSDRTTEEKIDQEIDEDNSFTYELFASDVEGDDLNFSAELSANRSGELSLDANNLQFIPADNFFGDVNINVSVPLNALADEAVVYEIKLVRNGDILDSDTIAVYAGEKHGIDLGVSVTTQSGKDGATVSYPVSYTHLTQPTKA